MQQQQKFGRKENGRDLKTPSELMESSDILSSMPRIPTRIAKYLFHFVHLSFGGNNKQGNGCQLSASIYLGTPSSLVSTLHALHFFHSVVYLPKNSSKCQIMKQMSHCYINDRGRGMQRIFSPVTPDDIAKHDVGHSINNQNNTNEWVLATPKY